MPWHPADSLPARRHRMPREARRPPTRVPTRVPGRVPGRVLLLALALTAGAALAAPSDAAGQRSGPPPAPARSSPPAARLLDGSAITFEASDPLGGFTGHAPVAGATVQVDPARPATARGSLTVRANSITTGNVIRDRNAERGVFEAERYPVVRYAITGVRSDPTDLRDGGTSRLEVTGELTLHGTTRQVVATGTVTRRGDRLEAKLRFDVHLTAFGMDRPRFLFIQVDDLVKVDVALALRSTAAP